MQLQIKAQQAQQPQPQSKIKGKRCKSWWARQKQRASNAEQWAFARDCRARYFRDSKNGVELLLAALDGSRKRKDAAEKIIRTLKMRDKKAVMTPAAGLRLRQAQHAANDLAKLAARLQLSTSVCFEISKVVQLLALTGNDGKCTECGRLVAMNHTFCDCAI